MGRYFLTLSLTLGVLATLTAPQVWADDREVAQQIADVMRATGAMKSYDVAVKYNDGTAILQGQVTSQQQINTAIAIAQASPYVEKVENRMIVRPAATNQRDPSLAGAGSLPAPIHRRSLPGSRTASGPVPVAPSSLPGSPRMGHPGMARGMNPALAAVAAPIAAIAGQGRPQPAYVQGAGGGVAPASYDQPHLPGYAWPSYAPYPNYAALTYPKQYSPTAWPYIGPFYPYPQVPLGWRKVTMEWDDGWWFLDFKDK